MGGSQLPCRGQVAPQSALSPKSSDTCLLSIRGEGISSAPGHLASARAHRSDVRFRSRLEPSRALELAFSYDLKWRARLVPGYCSAASNWNSPALNEGASAVLKISSLALPFLTELWRFPLSPDRPQTSMRASSFRQRPRGRRRSNPKPNTSSSTPSFLDLDAACARAILSALKKLPPTSGLFSPKTNSGLVMNMTVSFWPKAGVRAHRSDVRSLEK